MFIDPEDPNNLSCKRIEDTAVVKKTHLKINSLSIQQISNWRNKLSTGYVWVEGDNASNSVDSRFYGPIPRNLITGKVFCRFSKRNGSFKSLL